MGRFVSHQIKNTLKEVVVGYLKYCPTICLVGILSIGEINLDKPKDFMGKKLAENFRKYL
jgi:hypothetical protein